jgi:hypothetical protein
MPTALEIRTIIGHCDKKYYNLKGIMDPEIWDSCKLIGLRRFKHLAMECVEGYVVDCPTINDVTKELEIII